MSVTVHPFFLGERGARRFYLNVVPSARAPHAGLVFVAPLAEEMNKSRRMVTLAARAFAARGVSVLLVDLLGTGDSAGDFSDATWNGWLDDIRTAHAWLRESIQAPVGLWGLRLGALIATTAASHIHAVSNLLLWQPVVSGNTHLTQFLRLKVAAEAMAGGPRQTTQQLMDQCARGRCIEVAGYLLPSALALPVAAARLELPAGLSAPIEWIEVSATTPPSLLPGSQATLDAWRAMGANIRAIAVAGPAFWQTQEIEVCEALAGASLRFSEPAA